MPFYDFRCKQCEHTFSVRATFKEKEAGLHPACPVCQADETQQVLSAGILIGLSAGLNERSFASSAPMCGCGSQGCCG